MNKEKGVFKFFLLLLLLLVLSSVSLAKTVITTGSAILGHGVNLEDIENIAYNKAKQKALVARLIKFRCSIGKII